MSALSPLSFRFRPREHLRRPEDFKKVYDHRHSASDGSLVVYACPNQLNYLRLGMSVSRKFGMATSRNRLRRLYREAFRLCRDQMPVGLDLVLLPRGKNTPTLVQLRRALPQLVSQLARRLDKRKKLR